jgi:acyl-CoA synthetase (AMP-forming)/AMP-acid ligase II
MVDAGNAWANWSPRPIPAALAAQYVADGWWTDATLGATVAEGLTRLSDVEFQVHSQVRPWAGTFGDVDRAARSLAASLAARGVGAGSVVMVQLPNWVEAAVSFFAAAYLGAVIVPVVHFYGAKEVGYILGVTRPDVLITADRFGRAEYLETYSELVRPGDGTRWLVVGDTPAGDLPAAAEPFAAALDAAPLSEPRTVDPSSPTIIAFTSGTTRDPKGVVHSHRTILCETRQLDWMYPVGGPPQITGTPVGHFMGMVNALLIPLLRDSPVHLLDVWDPGEVLRLMAAHQLGVSGGATYFLTSLLDHPDCTPEHVRLIPFMGLGGSPIPAPVAERAARLGISLYRAYGSTEHPSITTSLVDEPAAKRLLTDGHVLPGVELRLDDDGEIISRGPDLCLGYTDPELTAKAFDDEGWYRTGDVGVLDAEGYLTITDRISDVIIRGGENISAQEVEDQLLGLDAIAEVAVVAAPDERLGERAAAIVRVREGSAVPTLDDVRAHLTTVQLAKQKWPESIHVVAEFPRTPSGKIQKFRLRQQLREGTLEELNVDVRSRTEETP